MLAVYTNYYKLLVLVLILLSATTAATTQSVTVVARSNDVDSIIAHSSLVLFLWYLSV